MFERIKEKIRISNIPVEVERTVVPISQYQELEKELERLKEELKKLREENEQLKTENANLKLQIAIPEEEVKREPDICPRCGWTALNKVFRPTSQGWECVGKLCFHCYYFEPW